MYFITIPSIRVGGDVVEYFGTSVSVMNHAGINLTPQDKTDIEKWLGNGYFKNPEYYLTGRDNNRFPVHFFAYSLVNVPVHAILRLTHQNELKTFALTNTIILSIIVFLILFFFVKNPRQRLMFIILVYLSPLIYHLAWPGPEVFSLSLILLSIFLFFENRFIAASVIAAVAAWQSQPLIFIPLSYAAMCIYYTPGVYGGHPGGVNKSLLMKNILMVIFLTSIIFLPNIYYYIALGAPTAYAKLSNVGLSNFTFKKLYELFFDLNIGVFFYMPVLFITGATSIFLMIKKHARYALILIPFFLVALFYLTNNNWNNGTAGYGPTRYSLFVIPLFIYTTLILLSWNLRGFITLTAFIALQIFVLSFNGFLTPNLENTLVHTPYAKFALNKAPGLYNPTEEIFVERTSNREGGYWNTTVYKENGACKKAFVILTDEKRLVNECDFIPAKYTASLNDDFQRKASYKRIVKTTEATFYPADGSCAWDYKTDETHPFVCMKTLKDAKDMTGISDEKRLIADPKHPGVWKLSWADPAPVTVPPGYVINYYSLKGVYVNY